MMGRREFDFPLGLKPDAYDTRSGTAEQHAEKVGNLFAARTKVRAVDQK